MTILARGVNQIVYSQSLPPWDEPRSLHARRTVTQNDSSVTQRFCSDSVGRDCGEDQFIENTDKVKILDKV